MDFKLSIFVDRFGAQSYCRHDVLCVSSLRALDEFTTGFKDSRELRRYYASEFAVFNEKYGKEHPGKMYANSLLDDVGIITIAIMYHGDEIVPDVVAYNNIEVLLNDEEKFRKFLEEKRYLLKLIDIDNGEIGTDSSVIRMAEEAVRTGDYVIRREVINRLISAIKRMDEERRYFYFRSLVNLCDLRRAIIHLSDGNEIPYLTGQTIMPEYVLFDPTLVSPNLDDNESTDESARQKKKNIFKEREGR